MGQEDAGPEWCGFVRGAITAEVGKFPSASLVLFILRPSNRVEGGASLAERLQSWHRGRGDIAKSANWQMANWRASKGTEETMEMPDNCRIQCCWF